MKVSSLMTKKVISSGADVQAAQAYLLMEKNNFRHLPIVDSSGFLWGMITRADLREALDLKKTDYSLVAKHFEMAVQTKDLCPKKAMAITPETDVRVAAQIMVEKKIGALPVVDITNRLVGIITESDILSTFVQFMSYLSDSDEICLNLPDKKDSLNKVFEAIRSQGVEILSVSMSKSERKGRKDFSFRVQAHNIKNIKKSLSRQGFEVQAY